MWIADRAGKGKGKGKDHGVPPPAGADGVPPPAGDDVVPLPAGDDDVPPPAGQSEGDGDGGAEDDNHVVSMFDGNVMCDSCERYSDFKKCRIISKRAGTWRCGLCGVKSAQLRRLYGSWPTGEFTLLPKERIACHPIHHQW